MFTPRNLFFRFTSWSVCYYLLDKYECESQYFYFIILKKVLTYKTSWNQFFWCMLFHMIIKQDRTHSYFLFQSLLAPMFDKETVHAIKKGLLWHQRDRLFSRWKERYFILTRDYLHCFRRASGSERISEMGQFLLKIKLVDVEKVEWENKKTYSAVVLNFGRDGKIFLRATEGLEEWFEYLEECTLTSKERRKALRHSHDGRPRENNNITPSLDDWLTNRQKIRKYFYWFIVICEILPWWLGVDRLPKILVTSTFLSTTIDQLFYTLHKDQKMRINHY